MIIVFLLWYTLALFLTIAILMFLLEFFIYTRKPTKTSKALFVLSAFTCTGLILPGVILLTEHNSVKKNQHVILKSLQDNSSVSGSLFLGSGSVDGRTVYTWYEKSGDSYQLKIKDAESVIIKYTNSVPHLDKPYIHAKQEWLPTNYTDDKYTFYIPYGSIKQNYEWDGK